MKKTLVALAALAVVGAASAQSSVTLYGKIDVHVVNRTQKTAGVATAAGNVGLEVNSAGLSGSRWGMKGSEDLGGGLRAIFDLQSGFNIDTGASAQGGLLFGRQAFVGLAGGFGTFTAGRQYSPIDTVWGTYDAQGYTTNSAMNYAWNGGAGTLGAGVASVGIHAEPGRINNSLLYATPAMGGFNAQVMYAPGENKAPGVSAGNYVGFLVGYAAGPLGLHLGYESINAAGAVPANLKDWTIGAQYDLGVARLYGGYQRATQSAVGKDTGWMFGAAIPISAMTLNLGYAREKTTATGAAVSGKTSAFGGQLVYPLSKRTNVYGDFMLGQSTPAGGARTKNNIFGVGMRHDF